MSCGPLERRLHLRPVGQDQSDRNAEIYRQWDDGATQTALALEHNLSQTRIGQIVARGIRRDPEAWEREKARHPGDGRRRSWDCAAAGTPGAVPVTTLG